MASSSETRQSDLPDLLDRRRHLDAPGRVELIARRVVVTMLAAAAALALVGMFGQRPSSSVALAESAKLDVSAPSRIRGGLFFQGRFTIEARAAIRQPTLVLSEGWLDGISVNTLEPAPVAETSREGGLELRFDALAPGDTLVVYMQFQVNPTTVGRRSADVDLADGRAVLAHVDRTLTILP